jgi:hypothetical protein
MTSSTDEMTLDALRDEVRSLRAEVRALQDLREIERTLDQYCYSSDFPDPEQLLDCFTEDGAWLTSIGPSPRGREELREWCKKLTGSKVPREDGQGRRGGLHHRTNTQIILDGDTAQASSYLVQIDANGPKVEPLVIGRYLDELVRCDDGRWRYKTHRTEVEAHDVARHSPIIKRDETGNNNWTPPEEPGLLRR